MMTEEQSRFEQWAAGIYDTRLLKDEKGNYRGQVLQQLWQAWQAALTQPASPALKLPEYKSPCDYPDVFDAFTACKEWNRALNMVKELNGGADVISSNSGVHSVCSRCSGPSAPHTAPIEPICATGGAEAMQLPDLNDDLIDILGRPNFTCSSIAQILRMGGRDIPRKSENEQAAAIHFLLNHYLADNEKWLQAAGADLKAMGVCNE